MRKIFLTATLGVVLFSCKKTDDTSFRAPDQLKANSTTTATPVAVSRETANRVGDGGCTPVTKTVSLMAGQTINAGTVTVTNDGTTLFVTYSTTNGWAMSEVQLYVGELANAPQNNGGNPTPGRFPIKQNFSPSVTTATYSMPLSGLPDCFVVAAHCVVKTSTGGSGSTQTGWGQGTQFGGNNWGMYFDYCQVECL